MFMLLLINFFLFYITYAVTTKHCYAFDSNDVCIRCTQNYVLIKGECTNSQSAHCALIDDQSRCLECFPGHKFDFTTNKCVSGEDNCSEYYFNDQDVLTCKSCVSNFTLFDSKTCGNCSGLNDGCLKGTTDCKTCTECADNYKLVNNKCELYQPNCQKYDVNTQQCVKCIDGYFLYERIWKCIRGEINNCLVYKTETECSVCETSYFVINNKCVKKAGCTEVTNTQCSKCAFGYSLINSECHKCVSDCLKCTENACLECTDKYILEGTTCKNCTEKISHCVTCSQTKYECEECESGYGLVTGQRCIAYPDACTSAEEFNTQLSCTSCKDGYQLTLESPSLCIKCGVNCKTCEASTPSQCKTCLEGYILVGTTCTKCADSNCGVCTTTTTSSCTDCKNGYYMDGTTCKSCAYNCDKLTTKDECDKCESVCKFYGDVNGVCREDLYCLEYDIDRDVCLKCQQTYYLDSNYKCKKCTEKCKDRNWCVDSDSWCVMTYGVENCQVQDNRGICTVCDDNMKVNNSGKCDPYFRCVVRNSLGECTECYAFIDNGDYYYTPDKYGVCYLGGARTISILFWMTMVLLYFI
ncbi:hypothetical protein EIN_193200 [Entamoeba invadens IP1]|uniref:EGF-like domain-containing protein n=1 Tax=Entamoeba invadens IP1 TaxID=370355 RepID=A0A0A1U3H0_ENTIV|nr:hypothetical protein EIN_193200 [Entamoeba invadens IP1]ELP88681.1 hypothetical protein EIN_193200 [Entamoeba invadens IP1]|eukprot:XP_004255452.1 hypothetical protein EIN_193200 [Entamoeba invadens IP1]